MNNNFDELLVDIQSGLISLCLELTEESVDVIYAYASIEYEEDGFVGLFNAFFEKDNKIYTLDDLNLSLDLISEFLSLGTNDLEKIILLCKENETLVPTEMKMIYDVNTEEFNVNMKYDSICNSLSEKEPMDIFAEWIVEVANEK